MKLTNVQSLIAAGILLATGVILFLTGNDTPASLCVGGALGILTPSGATGGKTV